MGEETKIGWCDHTFNPWEGCVKVSAECDHCYAEERDRRYHEGKHWGKDSPRKMMAEAYWRKLAEWDRKAARDGVLRTVFVGSLCDIMEDHPAVMEPRQRLLAMVPQTQHLVYLLLTKRPQNFRKFLPKEWVDYNQTRNHPWNFCAMTTVGETRSLWRIPELLKAPARWSAVSYEPALEWVSFANYYRHRWECSGCGYRTNEAVGTCKGYCQDPTGKSCDAVACPSCGRFHYWCGAMASLDWTICGGESGANARPFQEDWALRTIQEAHENPMGRVPVFFKQYGANAFAGEQGLSRIHFADKKCEMPAEWPEHMRVQEQPDWLQGVPCGHPLFQRVYAGVEVG